MSVHVYIYIYTHVHVLHGEYIANINYILYIILLINIYLYYIFLYI